MMMLQQISSWRSILGSKMGDPALMPQLPTGLDDVVPPSMVMQFHQGFFKRPRTPTKFGIDKQLASKAMPRPSRTASPAPSLVQVGETAAKISQRAAPVWEQSPSPGAQDRQQTGHESRDPSKKMTPVKKVKSKGDSQLGKESNSGQPKKQATAPTTTMGREGFDAYPRPPGSEQAGLSPPLT